jgi:hypothetical protein
MLLEIRGAVSDKYKNGRFLGPFPEKVSTSIFKLSSFKSLSTIILSLSLNVLSTILSSPKILLQPEF